MAIIPFRVGSHYALPKPFIRLLVTLAWYYLQTGNQVPVTLVYALSLTLAFSIGHKFENKWYKFENRGSKFENIVGKFEKFELVNILILLPYS